MKEQLARPYYQDTGRRPYLFYAAIGANAEELHVSRSRHHIEEMPEGLGLSRLQRPGHSGHMDELLGGALGKILDERDYDLYKKARAAQSWLVLYGEVQKDDTLDYLRNALGFVQAAVETGAVAVLDLQMLELYPAQGWTQRFFSAQFHPYSHVNAMISPEEGGTLWLHTRGMRKFGRPDMGMTGVPQGELDRAKAAHGRLTLNVYRNNDRAAAFYRREGFQTRGESVDESTGEAECRMVWERRRGC